MVTGKQSPSGGGGSTPGADLTNLIKPTTSECCMCGDYGLPQELFRCKICKSRFQHKYCSNLYPKAELYKACNWCLTKNQDSGNSNNSGDDHAIKINKKTPLMERRKGLEIIINPGRVKIGNGSLREIESPVSAGRKRVAGGVAEEKNRVVLRKSKSANYLSSGGGIKTRPVFKNKVRRYKLLDEVSSQ